jgi:hypothetical protein
MGLFSLTQELAIDLGTANTLIIHNGKVVVDEPSIVALDVHTGKLVAIGTQARQMHEKTNPNIKTIRPLKDGVIADFNATELMLRGMIKKVKTSGNLFAPSIRMVICIPSGSTNVEIRAVRDSAEHAGGREVYMIYEPMAAALGAGLDVEAPEGNMVIDYRDRLHFARRHRLLRVDQCRGRCLYQRYSELRASAAQHPYRRTHGRGDQVFDRCGAHRAGRRARGLRGNRS